MLEMPEWGMMIHLHTHYFLSRRFDEDIEGGLQLAPEIYIRFRQL